jgi:hypothetical protein
MDAAEDHFIEFGHLVCGQEYNSLQIFQLAEKYSYKAAAE